jgi:hypothetical protein
MFDDLSTKDKLLLGFIALIVFAGAMENAGALILLMLLGGFVYYDSDRRRSNGREQNETHRRRGYGRPAQITRQPVRRERPVNVDQVYPHALKAARAAGLNPDTVPVLPVDLGVMAYHGNTPPVIHRTVPVEDDCDYIQPFIQLRVPRVATGQIRFEIVDKNGKVVFIHEDSYQLKRGRNLIVPSARLPIHDEQEIDGAWELQVSGDNMMLAKYRFDWLDMKRSDAHRFVGEDGEINSEMRAVLAESRLQRMSLDELLIPQDDDLPAQQAGQ